MRVRTTKTGSGSTAVQVVERYGQRTKIVKHIGSAKDKKSLITLLHLAHQYIQEKHKTIPLFPDITRTPEQKHIIAVENLVFTNTYHHFAYEFFSFFYALNGFNTLENPVLKDLSIMRLFEPASKQTSVELLRQYFRITYGHTTLYKALRSIRTQKESIEQIAITYAKKYLSFDFSLVFYDVTTLYFETFKADEDRQDIQGNTIVGLRTLGFSKDNKPQQPQVMIGLVVNRDGYPISIEMFSGKTFEGHTLIPVIKKFKEKYHIEKLTIVADAGMLSLDNIEAIKQAKLSYIVGARLGSIQTDILKEISEKLNKTEGVYHTIETSHGKLICDYLEKRAIKDRFDQKKQIVRAQYQIDNPKKVKRKARFVQEETDVILKLNETLIAQDTLKEGIKGYYTNLENIKDDLIVQRYKDLWHVEKAFRITKSDLKARPIFHHKRDTIEAHMLIVFVSLCLAKSIELLSHNSIKKVKRMVWPILDIEFKDKLTNKTFIKRMETEGNPMAELWIRLQHEY